MTDLEMTKLCAEAIGAKLDGGREYYWLYGKVFQPLTDDAQAMALLKRFRLVIGPHSSDWTVGLLNPTFDDVDNEDLNRAIVECVAKMQASVSPPDNAVSK